VVQWLWDSVAPSVRAGRIDDDMASNKRRRHTPDQIIRELAEGNKLLASGQELVKLPATAPDAAPGR
jgi:hypothetical protein